MDRNGAATRNRPAFQPDAAECAYRAMCDATDNHVAALISWLPTVRRFPDLAAGHLTADVICGRFSTPLAPMSLSVGVHAL